MKIITHDPITVTTGATVLKATLAVSPDLVCGVALCDWQERHEYVVWHVYRRGDDSSFDCEQGSYFPYAASKDAAYDKALAWFRKRAATV